MKDISVLIPDGEHSAALNVMRSLGQTRRVMVELMSSQRSPSTGLSRYCRKIHYVPAEVTGENRIHAIEKILAKSPADVLMPVTIEGIYMVAAAKKALSAQVALPPMPSPAAMDIANDKASLSQLARQLGVAVPPFMVYPDEVPDHSALSRLSYPVLLKHPSSEGGRNIHLFNDAQSLSNYFDQGARGSNGSRRLLQSYLKGEDYGLNVLCRDGEILAFTVQKNPVVANPPFGPAAGIHFVHDPRVLETGRRILKALAWSGVANLDMLHSKATGEMMLLEINPRYWGTLMGSLRAGVNFPYLASLAALGRPLPDSRYAPIAYADKSVAMDQVLRKITGRPALPGLQFKNTALSIVLTDPLPSMSIVFRKKWTKLTRNHKKARSVG